MSNRRNGYGFLSNGSRDVVRSNLILTDEEFPIQTSAQRDIGNSTRLKVNHNNGSIQQQPFIRSNAVVRYVLFQKVDDAKYSEFSVIIPDMVVTEFIVQIVKLQRHGEIRTANNNNNMPLSIITSNLHLQPLLLVLLLEQITLSNF